MQVPDEANPGKALVGAVALDFLFAKVASTEKLQSLDDIKVLNTFAWMLEAQQLHTIEQKPWLSLLCN